jgi:hypothetical protein
MTGSSRNSSQYNSFQTKVDSNPIAHRVRRKRQRLPPVLSKTPRIEISLAHRVCPRRFRSRLASIQTKAAEQPATALPSLRGSAVCHGSGLRRAIGRAVAGMFWIHYGVLCISRYVAGRDLRAIFSIYKHLHHFAKISTCRKTINSLSFVDNYYLGTHHETFDRATRDLGHFADPDRPQLDSRSADLRSAGDQLPG